jgi:hypothetical protein
MVLKIERTRSFYRWTVAPTRKGVVNAAPATKANRGMSWQRRTSEAADDNHAHHHRSGARQPPPPAFSHAFSASVSMDRVTTSHRWRERDADAPVRRRHLIREPPLRLPRERDRVRRHLGRIKEAKIAYGSALESDDGKPNDWNGGPRRLFQNPNGHVLELMTVPQ